MQAKHPAGHTSMMKSKDHMMMKGGGPVKGPGTGTSDSIPIMASDGEYMMPADSVKKIGVKVLDAMKDATHKPVMDGKMPMKAGAGMPKKMMADGGKVEETDHRNHVTYSQPGGTTSIEPKPGANTYRTRNSGPTDDTGNSYDFDNSSQAGPGRGMMNPPRAGARRKPMRMADGGLIEEEKRRLMPGTAATLKGSGEDASAALKAGNYGAAAGHVLRGTAALPVALADDVVGQPLRKVVAPIAAGVGNALNTAATGNSAPAFGATGPVAAAAPPVTANPTDLRLDAGVQAAPGMQSEAPTTTAEPGTQPGLGARGPVSAQNMGAADALSARYDTSAVSRYNQEVADAAATNAAGGFGVGGAQSPRARLLGQLGSKRLTPRGARVVADLEKADATAGTEQARLGVDKARLGVEQGRAATEEQSKAALITAQQAFLNAKTPEEKAAAAQALAVLQGRVKETPDLFDRVQTGIDPATGAPVFSIYSKRTGQVQGPAGAAQAPAVGTVKGGFRFKGGNPADQKSWEKA